MDQGAKTRTNVSVDAGLLSEARLRGVNVSASLEEALRETLTRLKREEWLAENLAAIEATHQFLEQHGLWSDGLRQF